MIGYEEIKELNIYKLEQKTFISKGSTKVPIQLLDNQFCSVSIFQLFNEPITKTVIMDSLNNHLVRELSLLKLYWGIKNSPTFHKHIYVLLRLKS